MKEKTSKIILWAEMIILNLPTTFYFIFCSYFIFRFPLGNCDSLPVSISYIALLFCAVAIFSSWHSCIYFIRHGRLGLNEFPYVWKLICYLAGIYVLISWFLLYLYETDKYLVGDMFSMSFLFGLFGTPFMLSLLHLVLEWNTSNVEKRYE